MLEINDEGRVIIDGVMLGPEWSIYNKQSLTGHIKYFQLYGLCVLYVNTWCNINGEGPFGNSYEIAKPVLRKGIHTDKLFTVQSTIPYTVNGVSRKLNLSHREKDWNILPVSEAKAELKRRIDYINAAVPSDKFGRRF